MKKTLFLLFFSLCVLFTGTFSNLTYAFLTDKDPQVNQVGIGHNDSNIEESFPTPSPIPPGQEQVFTKVVSIKNNQSVPCYIRVSVGFSDSSIGDAISYERLNTTDWVYISSTDNAKLGGYYYYRNPVSAGESTIPLFQGIKIGASADLSTYENGDTFQIFVYEESVQCAGYRDYQDAWNQFLKE